MAAKKRKPCKVCEQWAEEIRGIPWDPGPPPNHVARSPEESRDPDKWFRAEFGTYHLKCGGVWLP
jgi:hypothetical protein